LIAINVFLTNSLIFSYTNTAANYTNGLIRFNLTTNRPWQFSFFSAVTVRWTGVKGGGASGGGSFKLDESGFEVTTSGSTGGATRTATGSRIPMSSASTAFRCR